MSTVPVNSTRQTAVEKETPENFYSSSGVCFFLPPNMMFNTLFSFAVSHKCFTHDYIFLKGWKIKIFKTNITTLYNTNISHHFSYF